MDLYQTLKHMYPDLEDEKDYVLKDEGAGPFILDWKNTQTPEPSSAEIENHWTQFKDDIANLFKPKPSQIDTLEKTQTDLIFTLMDKGVI